jgi:CDGSH-type Zn-finger protein
LELFDSSRYASNRTKFVAAEYGDQHATSVHYPEMSPIDTDGSKFPVEKRMALCRCGASTEKPFCDGTHSKIGFNAAEKAVPQSKE